MKVMRSLEGFLSALAVQLLVGFDLRPLVDEVQRGLASLDAVPCSHCGLTDHSGLHTDADWLSAKELGAFSS